MTNLINQMLPKFASFLNQNWSAMEPIFGGKNGSDIKLDWLQVNWELIVESQLSIDVYLQPYGDGADCNGSSSRVTFPEKLPTHEVQCIPTNGKSIRDYLNENDINIEGVEIVFDRFVTLDESGWYADKSPFNKVLCTVDDSEVVLGLGEIRFALLKTKTT